MNQKEAKATRETFYGECEKLTFGDFSFEGHTREGILFSNDKGNFVVIKAIVKQDTFDSTDAMEEWAEAQEKARKRAEKKEK